MKVCVFGLWHLGTVTAACLASIGHEVAGLDDSETVIEKLNRGEPPLYEPGLPELVRSGMDAGRLRFTTDRRAALAGARVVWITFDTPVDDNDRADVGFVMSRAESLLKHVAATTLVIVSSQLPVGSVKRLEAKRPGVKFVCSPENLRLGKAIDAFLKPDRIVVGTRSDDTKPVVNELLGPIKAPIEWMSIESAEMTKHALNAFLATSIAFINEIATVCEAVGADATEVARGLKSDPRIGQRSYLSPGGPFAGGTLARDIEFLREHGDLPLISSVKTSNDRHKNWTRTKLTSVLGTLEGKRIAIWGLTYKPGTDTLRRSMSVELCRWLVTQGAQVRAHDPAVKTLPADLDVMVCNSPKAAADGANALVIGTEWPDYRGVEIPAGMIVIDPNGFLGARPGIRYYSVGKST
ncbi:MAG TPA: nucleotide sugar dehydrogenase [Thermoanaerobaculia bacterium]|nr:nucleotide sugar dehydrogenase [Thermoanaerobaculia bacterium]